MAEGTTTQNDAGKEAASAIVKFCPICGAQLYQGVIYGFDAWICPENDWFEFTD